MCLTWISLVLAGAAVGAEPDLGTYSVGVAKIDVTPAYPVRLSGFGLTMEVPRNPQVPRILRIADVRVPRDHSLAGGRS